MGTFNKKKLAPEEVQRREQAFYKEKFYFSYSSMNRLLWNPYSFYEQYVLGPKEEKTDKHLIEGKVVHALLLSKQHFNKLFVVMPGKMPGESIKPIIDSVFKKYREEENIHGTTSPGKELKGYKHEILSILSNIDLYQSYVDDKPAKNGVPGKSGDDKRLEKVLTPEALSYWQHLLEKGTRDVIDQETLDFCNLAFDKVRSHPRIMEMMGLIGDEFLNTEVFNEQELFYELKNYSFGLKGIIDNLVLDHEKKVIRINDIKTSSRHLKDFQESIDYYCYWMQAVMYITLVHRQYKHLIDAGYTIEFRFIVIDRSHNVYPFLVTKGTMEAWTMKFYNESLFKANYHYTQRQYLLPYEFAEELIVL